MRITLTIIALAVILGTNIGVSASDTAPPTNTKADIMVLANEISAQYAVKAPLVKSIMQCESGFNPTATKITKREQSYGLVQINRLAHPSISIQQAEDPTYAITYLASNLKDGNGGMWTCERELTVVKSKSKIIK